MSEMCPVCGQPDNCGDCDHTPVRLGPYPMPCSDCGANAGEPCIDGCPGLPGLD